LKNTTKNNLVHTLRKQGFDSFFGHGERWVPAEMQGLSAGAAAMPPRTFTQSTQTLLLNKYNNN